MSKENLTRRGNLPVLRLIGTLGALALLAYLFSKQHWPLILGAVRQISWTVFLIAFLLTMLSRFAVISRWHILLRSAGVKIPYKHSASITFAGLFASNFLPTTVGGDVVRLAGAMRLKYDSAVCLASLIVDRLVGMAAYATAVPFGIPSLLAGPALQIGSLNGFAHLSLAVAAGDVVRTWWEKGLQMVRRLADALKIWLRRPKGLLSAVGFSWVRMLCEFTVVWLLLGSMGQHISFWLVAGLWSFTYFVTLLPISINGYGVQELILIFLFTHNGGVSQTFGVTLALLMRALQLLASLPGALFVPGIIAGENNINPMAEEAIGGIISKKPSRLSIWQASSYILFAAVLVGFSWLALGPIGPRLSGTPARLAMLGVFTLGGLLTLKAASPGRSLIVALIVTLIGIGSVYQVASYIPQVSAYPFSLGWSEASRYYYASLFFSRSVYGVQTALSVLHPTRYLMQSIPFLIPNVPLWINRLWQVILWLVFTGLAAGMLARRLPIAAWIEKLLFFLWASLFLLQGPVYYHLLVMVILVLWGFDLKKPWKTMAFVLIASLWAGVSRINWAPVPGMLAAAMYFLSMKVDRKPILNYLVAPAAWTLVGSGAALVVQKLYERISGNPAYEFGSSFTSDLLWYRLLPSHTFSIGVLPAAFIASLGVLLIVLLKLRPFWRQYHPIRLLGLASILFVLFVGGTVVSVKIGGGSNLHNLDAYLCLLLVIASYIYYDRFEVDNSSHPQLSPANTTLARSFSPLNISLALAVLAPVVFVVTVGDPIQAYDYKTATENLAQIKQRVEQAVQAGGQVLFISERQLLTFHEINAPLNPDYELVFLMEMSMANNRPYLNAFHNELKAHKYALIVSQPLTLNIQGSKHVFGEENDAWVRGVSQTMLCYYKPAATFSTVKLVLYVPRADTGSCQ